MRDTPPHHAGSRPVNRHEWPARVVVAVCFAAIVYIGITLTLAVWT